MKQYTSREPGMMAMCTWGGTRTSPPARPATTTTKSTSTPRRSYSLSAASPLQPLPSWVPTSTGNSPLMASTGLSRSTSCIIQEEEAFEEEKHESDASTSSHPQEEEKVIVCFCDYESIVFIFYCHLFKSDRYTNLLLSSKRDEREYKPIFVSNILFFYHFDFA